MSSKMEEILAGARNTFVATTRQRPATSSVDIVRIPVDEIDPDPDNARKDFNADELHALAEDMKRHGQIQNCICWHNTTAGRYQLIAGERRMRAAKLAGISTLMCLVVPPDMAEETKREIAFAENMARADLKPIEVARHWQSLMDRWGISARQLAARIGVAQSTVSKRVALLKLDEDTQRAVDAGEVHKTHALQSQRTPRGKRTGVGRGRGPRGVHTFAAGTVKLKRGHTLADLVAEIHATAKTDTAAAA